jgi:hypothetical protein
MEKKTKLLGIMAPTSKEIQMKAHFYINKTLGEYSFWILRALASSSNHNALLTTMWLL